MDDEGKMLLIFGHWVIGQGQLCPRARGCHALRCLVNFGSIPNSNFLTRTFLDLVMFPYFNEISIDFYEVKCLIYI